jgi:hypothetical protein
MSFLGNFVKKVDPIGRFGLEHDPLTRTVYDSLKGATPPPPPGPPNPNDAANAAQSLTDQMRQRRGMLANIYAGANTSQPVTGKQTLGT